MSIKRVGGSAGAHQLDGPGMYNGATVAGAMTVGAITITCGPTLVGSIAAGAAVGTRASGGGFQVQQSPQLSIYFRSAADYIDLDFSGAYG